MYRAKQYFYQATVKMTLFVEFLLLYLSKLPRAAFEHEFNERVASNLNLKKQIELLTRH